MERVRSSFKNNRYGLITENYNEMEVSQEDKGKNSNLTHALLNQKPKPISSFKYQTVICFFNHHFTQKKLSTKLLVCDKYALTSL